MRSTKHKNMAQTHTDTVTLKLSDYNNMVYVLAQMTKNEVVVLKHCPVETNRTFPGMFLDPLHSKEFVYYISSEELIAEVKAIDTGNKELMKNLVAKFTAQHALITELGKQIEQIRSRSLWQRILNK